MNFNENMNLEETANILADASSRVLGALTAKYYQLRGMPYDVYENVYNTCVVPVMDYASEIWGYKKYSKLETVQNRAIKGYLGVGKTCPTPMIVGDSGWYPTHIRCKCKMLSM
jgi:hypothetical protein